MLYRKEIDGLRALAIVPVILFHAGVSGFGGGFVGVDVFFVISGYLITSILIAEKQSGKFSILKFYERRTRRILPALFFVILVCLPFAWKLMTPYQLSEFSLSVLAVSLFASNFLFWKQSDYFDASSELKPLLHTWSLAVEEQYYLIFPALLYVIWRFGKKRTTLIIVILAVASLACAQIYAVKFQAATFYLLHTRAWELLLGGMVSIFQSTGRTIDEKKTSHLGTFGLALIAWSIVVFDKNTPFPSVYALVPTIGAALIILFAKPGTFSEKVLGSRVFVVIGLVSYSAYLWHQPILAFLKIYNDSLELNYRDFAILFSILIPATYFSYRFVERPFRSSKATPRHFVFAFSAAGISVFSVIGYFGFSTNGFLEYKLSQIKSNSSGFVVDIAKARADRKQATDAHQDRLGQSDFGNTTASKVLIIGDSMGDDLALALSENSSLFPDHEFRLLRLQNICIHDLSKLNEFCQWELQHLLTSPLIAQSDLVVVTFLWKEDANFAAIDDFLSALHKKNSKMLILGSAAFVDIASLSYKIASSNAVLTQTQIDEMVYKNRRGKFERGNKLAEKWAKENGVPYFDRKSLYCNFENERCQIILAGKGTVLWDNAHLTRLGMKLTAEKIRQFGWLTSSKKPKESNPP